LAATRRGVGVPDEPAVGPPRGLPEACTALVLDAALMALCGRIHLDETIEESPEDVVRQVWEDHFLLRFAALLEG
jgi:MoxR-like ATPase